jgi:hypothetical protein
MITHMHASRFSSPNFRSPRWERIKAEEVGVRVGVLVFVDFTVTLTDRITVRARLASGSLSRL